MPRLKRVSENELNKDIYDAGEDDRFGHTPDPGRGMSRASKDVIQKRKIIKVARQKFGGIGNRAPAAPTAPSASQQPAPASNPFASTTLTQSTTMPSSMAQKGGNGSSSQTNPFAKISFASNSNSASSAPKFSFATPKPNPKPNRADAAASSALDTSRTNGGTAPKTSLLSTPRSSKGKKDRIRHLNQNFLSMIVDHWEGRMYSRDYSGFMKEYQQHAENLSRPEDDEGLVATEADAASATSVASSAPFSNPESQPAQPFKFGTSASAPASAAKLFSFGAAAAPPASGASFSFTAKSADAAAPPNDASSKPTFSFGAPASLPVSGLPPPSSEGADSESDYNDGKVGKVEKQENEQVLYEVRAKHVKFENKQWKKYGAGVLRLFKNKETSKYGMVIRNEIGKVQFNVGVSKGMKFEKVIKDGKKGKATYVKFLAIEDEKKGIESFMVQVKPDSVDKLHETLEGMVQGQ